MTDANGPQNNSNGRRQRRSARLTTGNASPTLRSGGASRIASGKASGKAPADKTDGQTADKGVPAQESPAVSRRSRRRRLIGGQIAGTMGSSDPLLNSTSSASASRIRGLDNPIAPAANRKASNLSRPSALKAAPSSRLLAPGQSAGQGNRRASGRSTRRAASNRATPAGSVPLSSSLVRRRSRRSKLPKYLISAIWILVGGLGLATIFGTVLANRPGGESNATLTASVLSTDANKRAKFPIPLGQEIPELKAKLEALPALYPNLSFKAFYVDVDTGDYVDVEGREAIAAASTIKLPILLAFFEEIDKGNIDPNQTIAILPEQIAEESGDMQLLPPGTQFTALEVATQMIVNSDNTATNMMIDLLGGAEALNARFASYGLEATQLNNPLPDIEGTNLTSARDLVHSMLLVQSDMLTMKSRDRILNILSRTENKRLLPVRLKEKGALTYNKTGFIGKMLGDVALVDLSNGKRYAVSVLVERPDNDGRAVELIHSISERTYAYTDQTIQPAVTPLGNPDGSNPGSSPAAEDAPNTLTITQPQDEATPPSRITRPEVEEEPYPSANPE